ncbi:MAG: RCC1 domain-containing protein [Polyangiaceae bacterium]
MFIALVVPALLAPLACTAILGDFTVGAAGAGDSGNPIDSPVTTDGPSDTTHFTDVVQIAAGKDHTCALRSTGEVFCWGDNSLGQLGNSASAGSPTPLKVANLVAIRAIAAGNNHTCALDGNDTSGGKVYCWGSDSQGQLGSSPAGGFSGIPQTLASPTDLIGITAGTDYTCGFDSGGGVFCWGANDKAQLGLPHSASQTTPVTPSVPSGANEMSAGSEVTCAISSNALECWGTSNHGEIPVPQDGGALEYAPTNVDITVGDAGIKIAHVASGSTHVCATDTGGLAYCWGSNDYGESANNTTGFGAVVAPDNVLGITNGIAIGAGENYSCALTAAKY